MNAIEIRLPEVTLTRVGYVDIPIPADAVGLTPADFADLTWATNGWVEGESVRAGAATWFADAGDTRLAFDPVQAADGLLRADPATEQAQQNAIAELFADAGFPRQSVDLLVLTHIEGVGMVAWRDEAGGWSPFFPNARILISRRELAAFEAADPDQHDELTRNAWSALIALGVVDTFDDGDELARGLRARLTGGHSPGHAVIDCGDPEDPARRATMLGHLAVSPLHLATGPCAGMHLAPGTAWTELEKIAAEGQQLIGPLWPTPGHGRWVGGELSGEGSGAR